MSTRRVAIGAILGAVVALVLVSVAGGNLRGPFGLLSSDGQSGPPPTTTVPLQAPAHTCLTWNRADASDAQRVSCDRPHLFEVTGTVDLRRDFGPRARFPREDAWRDLIMNRCREVSSDALADRFDPNGRFSVGAIKPSRSGWSEGDRTLRCGLQAVGRSGALYSTTGSVLNQDQSDVHEPGSCLGNDARGVGDPVDCSERHAVEVVGVVDLVAAFPDGFPDEAAQDRVLSEECTRLAGEYAGGEDVVADKGLTVFWETLREESWNAGSKRVDCRLGAFLPDRSGFAPVTGSVRGEVRIGTEPAPQARPQQGPAGSSLPRVTDVVTPPPPPPR